MKCTICLLGLLFVVNVVSAQEETLQSVTDRGNTTTNSLQIGGQSVNANTTKLFINNPYGKNWALSSGANMIRETGFHIYNWTDNATSPLLTILDYGDVGFGTYAPQAGLDIFKSYSVASTKALKLFYNGSWGTQQYAANYRFIDIASTEEGKVLQLNAFGMGLGFDPPGYNSPDKLYVNGNIGVGTNNPQAKLEVVSASNNNQLVLSKKTVNWNEGAGIVFKNVVDDDSNLEIAGIQAKLLNGATGLIAGSLSFYTKANATKIEAVTINPQGDMGIGTATPKEKLSVNGKIRAHEIKVEATNWPDYIFEEGYEVGKLSALENYIKENKHLPEMPSAKEVEANGVALGEMNKKLLKNIEELTLHLIEINKRLEKLEIENQKLRKDSK